MDILLEPAQESDLHAIAALMNAAFRGNSDESWSVETDYLKGERTNPSLLREEISGGAHFLITKEDGALRGCVSLRPLADGRWYLGSLAVNPALQNGGFGRRLLAAAESYAAARGARIIKMTVINVRTALIEWYERRGYHLTGETQPFPYGDNRFGTPTRGDLEFVVLEKELGR